MYHWMINVLLHGVHFILSQDLYLWRFAGRADISYGSNCYVSDCHQCSFVSESEISKTFPLLKMEKKKKKVWVWGWSAPLYPSQLISTRCGGPWRQRSRSQSGAAVTKCSLSKPGGGFPRPMCCQCPFWRTKVSRDVSLEITDAKLT